MVKKSEIAPISKAVEEILIAIHQPFVGLVSVGSAITAKCDAEKEYEECMLKARAMKEILEN